jgi:type II secretory pathway pseudopilin PulG
MTQVRSEDGFTLVELLVTMLIMMIIFGAVLGALEAFQRQSGTANRRGDNQDVARRTMDRVTEALRGVVGSGTTTAVERAATDDVVFRTVDSGSPPQSGGSNAARLMFRRFCVDGSGNLYDQKKFWTTSAVPGVPSGLCGVATGWDGTQKLADHITNSGGSIFSYNPSATSVSSIGVDLSVDLDPNQTPAATTLTSGVSLRNVSSPPTVDITCQPGIGGAFCDTTGTADPDGGALTYVWSYGPWTNAPTTPPTCGTMSTLPVTQSQLTANSLTSGNSYCFTLVATDPSGMSDSDTEAVTVG